MPQNTLAFVAAHTHWEGMATPFIHQIFGVYIFLNFTPP